MTEPNRANFTPLRDHLSVGIGFPCGKDVPWQTAMALARTAHAAASAGVPANIYAVAGSSIVENARNAVLDHYLAGKEQHLFWIDSDIVWTPDDFFRVLRLASKLGVVSATYPIKKDGGECVVHFAHDDSTLNEHGCIEMSGTGLGFTCVRRDVLEAFAATKERAFHLGYDRAIIDAFRQDRVKDADGVWHKRGEDGAFFDDIRALGHKVWLDPTINLGHVGAKEYRAGMQELPSAAIE